MAYADEQSYEEVISALQSFMSNVSEACDTMEAAGNDCVDNMDGDPAAEKSNAKLQQCIARFRGTLGTAQNVIAAMQQELEDIRAAAAKADSLD